MLTVKMLKEIIKDLSDETEVYIESIIDNDDCMWSTVEETYTATNEENEKEICLVLQPTDIQICNCDNVYYVKKGVIHEYQKQQEVQPCKETE